MGSTFSDAAGPILVVRTGRENKTKTLYSKSAGTCELDFSADRVYGITGMVDMFPG